jgi:glycerophosphoryl diester phosphodiesterase
VITAKAKYCPWKKDTFTVQVVQKALGMQIAMPEELPSNEYYYLLHTGDEVSFVPLPDPLNGLVENLSFESSNPDVVTVTEDGAILAHKGGVAAIDVSWVGPYTEDGMTENLGRFWVNVCRKTDHDRLEDHELQWYEESCLVAHALGNAGEYIYTNTRDALEQSIEEGYLTLEVDLSLTSDGEVVCRHTWYSDDFEVSYDGTVPDLETFRKEKYFGTLSTLTGRELLEIWQEHPQLYFMLDVKQDENTNFLEVLTKFKALAEEMGCEELLEHMIVQLYAIEDYDKINEIYPVKHWLFTTYQLPDTPGAEIEAAAFAAEKDFGVLTVPAWCMSSDYFIELADEYGLDLFVHTVNTDSDIQRSSKRGIYGYYSDFLVPSDPAGNGE